MGLLDAILGKGGQSLSKKTGPWKISETPGEGWYGTSTSSAGVHVDPDSALSLSAVFAAANLLSRVLGSLPLQVYRQWGREKETAATHPAYRLLHTRPNWEMSSGVFRRVMEWNRLLWGGAYASISWAGNGKPAALHPIEGWRVQPDRREDGALFYKVDGTREVEPEDIISVPNITTDGTTCKSFVDYALESLGLGMAAQEFAGRLFGQGAKPGGVLHHKGNPDRKAREEMRESWERAHGGPGNAGRTAVLWGAWEYQAEDGTFAPEEAQLLETRRFTTEEVARWFGVPPHLLADLARATFSNIEEQGINFIVYSIGPTLVDYEQEYDWKLLDAPRVYSKHNVNALMRGSSAQRSAFYSSMFNMGAMTVNEIRELEDMNPTDGGDVHFIPANNMAPLPSVAFPPAAPPAPGPAPAPAPTPAPAPAASMARQDLLRSTLDRLMRVEANAVKRAAAKPDSLLSWMDEFYLSHQDRMMQVLGPVLAVAVPGADAATCSGAWCQASRESILTAAEVERKDFQLSIERLLSTWGESRIRDTIGSLEELMQ